MKNGRLVVAFWIVFLLLGLISCTETPPVVVTPSDKTEDDIALIVTKTLAALSSGSQTVSTSTPIPTLQPTNTPTRLPEITNTALPASTATPLPVISPTAAAVTPTATQVVPTATGTSVANSQSSTASNVDCIDKAAFVADVTIPDNTLLKKNTDFTKTWRIKNVGTCTWAEGYRLIFARGQILSGPPTSPLPNAKPGEFIDVSVNLKTPSEGGTYAGDWEFQNPAGKRFGVNSHGEDFIYLIIKVDWGPGIGPTPTPPPVTCSYQRNPEYETQLFQWINQERGSKGLAPLTLQSQLSAAAMAHSADMACNNFMDHTGSDKSTYSQRIKAKGYKASKDNENIYAGGSAQDAFDWWKGSPIHYGNMMSNQITQIGIGYAFYANSKFGGYYTLTFGRP